LKYNFLSPTLLTNEKARQKRAFLSALEILEHHDQITRRPNGNLRRFPGCHESSARALWNEHACDIATSYIHYFVTLASKVITT